MDIGPIVVLWPLLQVIAVVLAVLAGFSFLVWCIVGIVLWFVRGTHDTEVETSRITWDDE